MILRDFFIFQTWQHQKRSNSARNPSEMESWLQSFFQSICLNYCACHEKVMPGHTKCCACHAKSSQQTWRSDAPKCNPLREISALTYEQLRWKCLLYCACTENASLQILFKCPMPAIVFGYKTLTFCSLLRRCTLPGACHAKRSSERPKVVRTWCVLYILTSKCASRPQRHALFRHLNCQKVVGPGVFCTFWLRNVLRATTACNFSSLIWPDGSAPAQCFVTFLPFCTPISSSFWFFLFSDLLSSTLLTSLWLFPSLLFICAYCRKFDF